jgi:hypothetical protein
VPTQDSWSWIVWGREVLHFSLDTTSGSSWKPLPVLFTTVFIGMATGSALGSLALAHWGWMAVTALSASAAALALVVRMWPARTGATR